MGEIIVGAATLGSMYVLFALGMSLVWGTIGVLNFAQGATFMFAAFANYVLLDHLRMSLVPMILIGAAVGSVISVAIHFFAFRPILRRNRDRHAAEMQILICGIGLASIPIGIAQMVTLSNPFGYSQSSFKTATYELAGVRVTNVQLVVIVVGLSLAVAVGLWIQRSMSGMALRAIGVDAETSSVMGISETKLALTVMAVSGALAGIGGTLFTFNLGAITPETGDGLLLKAFAAIILGGVGSTLGTVAGAYFLAIAETVVLTQTSGTWVDAVSFGLLFMFLLVKPEGIFGRSEVRRT